MGSAPEFEEVFDDLFRRAVRVAHRILGDPAAAEDVAAEALARAYARWSKVGALPHRDAWVLRVAANLAIDVTRKRTAHLEARGTRGVDDDVAVRVALAAALRSLPRRQRDAIALRYLAGFSEAETAAAMKVSAGTIKTHLHRGTASLRARLGRDFGQETLAVD